MNLKTILTSNYTFNDDEYELKLKYILFNSLLLFNILLVSFATIARFLKAEYTLGFYDIIYISSGLLTFFLARQSKKYFKQLIYFVIFFSFLIVTLTFYSGLNPLAGISWFTIVLMTAIFFIYFFQQRNQDIKRKLKIANETLKKHNFQLNGLVKKKTHEILKFEQILEASPVSVIITDIEGNIEYSNPWFTKLTGYTKEEAIGINPKILKSDLHTDKYYTKLWDEIQNGKVWNGTFKNISKSGKVYWESAIIAPVNNEKGELVNFMAIKQEITQQVYLKNQLIQENKDKIENFEKTFESFVKMVEKRDTYTAGHSYRMADYAKLIAEEMQYSPQECELLHRASILHDIGKIATPDNVLLKPGKLSELEYSLIKEHVNASYEILSSIPMYKELADIIISHHERYDGKGYPHGLKGDEISPLAQIMIVSDAFDAMTTNRIYKGRKNIAEALEELQHCSGTQFDPNVVKSAVVALSSVQVENSINQLPKTDLEKERFSYFYRDQVTNVYNADYLKFILTQNHFNQEYACINTLYMHNFSIYNNKHGWTKGDELLCKFADYLTNLFPSTQIFRIYGDDFVLINREHTEIEMQQFKNLDILLEHNITITHRHTDLSVNDIDDLEELQH